jgi:hypothetical protein
MNLPIFGAGLLAQAENWREMGRDFRSDHTKLDPALIVASLLVFVAVVAFLVVLARFMRREEATRQFNDPKELFDSLCQIHELTPPQRRLLAQVAKQQNLPQPAFLFLEPQRLASAAGDPTLHGQAEQLRILRGRLFADLP